MFFLCTNNYQLKHHNVSYCFRKRKVESCQYKCDVEWRGHDLKAAAAKTELYLLIIVIRLAICVPWVRPSYLTKHQK